MAYLTRAVGLLGLCLFQVIGHAETIHFLCADIPPYCYLQHGNLVGVSFDLVGEMAKRQGITLESELVPYARAYRAVQSEPRVLAAQVGRTPQRESRFSWVVPLYREPFMLHVRADGQFDPDRASTTWQLGVGVLRDGLGDDLAKELGLQPLQEAADEQTNARKLRSGHINAWLASQNSARYAMQQAGMNPAIFLHGRVLRTYSLYLVSSPGMNAADVARWAKVFEEMKRDGSYDQILARYGYVQ